MRIAYDAKRAFHNFTGLGNYSRSLISAMAEFYPDNEYVLYTPPFKPHALHSFAKVPNVSVHQPRDVWKMLPSAVWRSGHLWSEIRRDGIALYHGLSHELPFNIRRSHARSVVTIHDLSILRYPEFYPALDRAVYAAKYRAACRNADIIVAISRQTQQDLVNMMGINPARIRIAYQSCDPLFSIEYSDEEKEKIRQKYDLPHRFILNVGTIERRKNLAVVVKALPMLPNDVHLVVVGRATEYMKEVAAVIETLHLQERVHFVHNVFCPDLPKFYQLAEAMAYPSVFEGFGIPILEALCSRLPVVAANASSLPEVGGNAALYVEPDDYIGMANALQSILSDSTRRNSMIAHGVEQAQKFSPCAAAQELWKIYAELL